MSDLSSSLHPRAAVSISDEQLIAIANNQLRNDIRFDVWSTFEGEFLRTKIINPVKIGQSTTALAGAAGNVDNGDVRYKITFVSSVTESNPGAASDVLNIADKTADGQVSLTAIPTGGTTITSRKIYRQRNGSGDYKLVGTISDNTTTTYTDNIADASLGATLPQGFALPSDYYAVSGIYDEGGNEIIEIKPVEGIESIQKSAYWIADGFIQFDPNHNFDGKTLRFRYLKDISTVSETTDDIPMPSYTHARMINLYARGISYFYLRDIDQPREVQYLRDDYLIAKAGILTGSVSSSPT